MFQRDGSQLDEEQTQLSHTSALPRPRLQTPSLLSELGGLAVFVIAAVVLFDLAAPRSLVEGRSMEPTFRSHDRLVLSRVHYLLGAPNRGDILVFNSLQPREAARGTMLIKRVVGLPGERVDMRNQRVYINGELLDEPYILAACWAAKCQDKSWTLANNEYFVMGDNRNGSNDSRNFGPVPYSNIVGEVIFRYWPINCIGPIAWIEDSTCRN